MKKITLVSLLVILSATIINAQISKGSLYLGGSVGASSYKQDNSNTTTKGKQKSIFFSPALGVAIQNNLIAGINFSYSSASSKDFFNYTDYNTHAFGAGVFLRKYYPIIKNLYFFGQSDLGYSQYQYEYPVTISNPYTSSSKNQYITTKLSAGIAFHLFKSVYIETGFPTLIELGYSKSTITNNSSGQTWTSKTQGAYIQSYLINSGSLNFGIRFIIPKK